MSGETIISHLAETMQELAHENTTEATMRPKFVADYKLVLLGESSVGKSSILQRVQNDTFDEKKSSTIGAAFVSKKVLTSGGERLINLQIWDTAGQERFHNLTPLYYRNSNTALIVFDLTDLSSFRKAEYWVGELENYKSDNGGPALDIVLVGNKLDMLSESVQGSSGEFEFETEVQQFVSSNQQVSRFFKVSAKLNVGLSELFDYVTGSVDESLFYSYDQSDSDGRNKIRNGLIDLRFTGSSASGSGSCQC